MEAVNAVDTSTASFRPESIRESKAYGLRKFQSCERIYIRPMQMQIAKNHYWQYVQYSLEQKNMNMEPPILTELYQFVGYGPNDEAPEGCETYYVCTAGLYSPLYAGAAEAISVFSPVYSELFVLCILLLTVCIFIEYRLFSVVQQHTIKSQRDLLVTVAHELKTPMGVVMLYGEKVEHGNDIPSMRQDAQALHGEIKRMNARLMDVLTVSRLDNMPAMPLDSLALDELLEDVCDEFLPLIEERDITLQTDIQPDIFVPANAFYIRTAVHNFLSNAVKFTPQGGRIALRLEHRHKTARVSVFNSGSHIEEKDKKKIWGSFYKAGDDADNRGKGTGLGLSIVQGIIRLHDGSCGLDNKADGVEFWFEVPLKQSRKGKMQKGVLIRKSHGAVSNNKTAKIL